MQQLYDLLHSYSNTETFTYISYLFQHRIVSFKVFTMSPKRVLYDSPECYPPNKRFLSERPDIKPGTLLTDIVGQRWRLGKPVGTGAFGEIFLASNLDDPTRANEKYVAKVESHKSGPLFVEINCYLRIAKFDMGKFLICFLCLIVRYVLRKKNVI